MARTSRQTTRDSIFHRTTAQFAVSFRVGSHLRVETSHDGLPFTDREDAYRIFMARGRDPRFDAVRLHVR
jgi:hypothetical protein